MNNQRRKAIRAVLAMIEEARGPIEELRGEEQDAFDSMPESLQESERGERAQEAVEALEEAEMAIDELVSALERAAE